MAAKDRFHNAVKIAIEKDGWTITHDPLYIDIEDVDFYVDLGAEKIIAAEKASQKIAIEVKSFLGTSNVTDFHLALGQCLNYSSALELTDPERILYLAVTSDVYDDFFQRRFIQRVIAKHQLKLLIFNAQQEEIVLWRN